MPIIFNNPLKACIWNKKYLITIQTRPPQIVEVYFLLKTVFYGFFKIICAQNQLPITVCLDLECIKMIKA